MKLEGDNEPLSAAPFVLQCRHITAQVNDITVGIVVFVAGNSECQRALIWSIKISTPEKKQT